MAGRPADKDSPQQRDRMTADLVTQSWPEGKVRNIDKADSRVRLPGEVSTFAHPDIGNALLSAELSETHEKEIQARLHAQDLQLRAVLDALPANIAVLDRNGTIIAVNRAWSRFAADNGAAGSLADGTGINYLLVCRDAARGGDISAGEAADGIEAVLSARQNHFSMEYPCNSPDRARWFAMSVTPLGISPMSGAITLHFDITARRQMEMELCHQREALALESRLHSLSEMASGIAHELSQPLTAITYYCDTLQALQEDATSRPEASTDLVERIKSQTLRATSVVSQLRDFMRRLTPELSSVSVGLLLQDALSFTEISAREKNVRLQLSVPEGLPPVTGDAAQLKQVLMHLLRNAIEATSLAKDHERTVTIMASLDPEWVRISVKDNGPGMDKTFARGIFDVMKMGTAHSLGLGLGISQSIVKAHGGRLWLDTTCDHGTCMHFTIPVAGEKHEA